MVYWTDAKVNGKWVRIKVDSIVKARAIARKNCTNTPIGISRSKWGKTIGEVFSAYGKYHYLDYTKPYVWTYVVNENGTLGMRVE